MEVNVRETCGEYLALKSLISSKFSLLNFYFYESLFIHVTGGVPQRLPMMVTGARTEETVVQMLL